MLPIFLQGLSLGLAFLAPIGMQNLFVINSALSHKLGQALATSLVVVFWDISLGVTCFLGAGALMDAFPWLKKIMLGLGGLLVIYIGLGLIRSEASLNGGKDVNQPFAKIIVAAFVVTWLNPQALIDGTMMLGAFRTTLPAGGDLPFIIGFTSASFIWFNGLAIASNALGTRINTHALTWINRVCGVVIICYGLKLLFDLAQLLFG
ncbi:LysE/ArgO family amino acid transporter [uncultured Slackia sp.]|uniref:LysE/ArgO family amino acid transporter n=1 Tax=uncultured Slackia sp. TaxID=665903 RepID=UPI0025E34926|nr:LysE family transporter [uncultured Slackia sp.]